MFRKLGEVIKTFTYKMLINKPVTITRLISCYIYFITIEYQLENEHLLMSVYNSKHLGWWCL